MVGSRDSSPRVEHQQRHRGWEAGTVQGQRWQGQGRGVGCGQRFHKHLLNISVPDTEQGPEDKVVTRLEPSPCWAHREEDWTDRKLILYWAMAGEVGYGLVGGPERDLHLGPGGPERSDGAADSEWTGMAVGVDLGSQGGLGFKSLPMKPGQAICW